MLRTTSSASPECPEGGDSMVAELRGVASDPSASEVNMDSADGHAGPQGSMAYDAQPDSTAQQLPQAQLHIPETLSSNQLHQPNNNSSNNTLATASIKPWLLIFVFSVFQILFSSTFPNNGVNASSNQAGSSNGGSGNSAKAGQDKGARVNTQPYFRQLPPITDTANAPGKIVTERMTEARRLLLRNEAKEMFMHGYHGYLNHAFPKDELNPVTCSGRGPDRRNPNNININDVLGDFSLTLIDALDTLALMREPGEFQNAIQLVKRHVGNFNIDSRVQVFEVNIRVLGALLSGHMYASDPRYESIVKGYKGELLDMAEDLGKRLLKAFENTPTGIPWPRVNLKKGVLLDELSETCVAGAGSLLLEFGVLSRWTGDKTYEEAAKTALFELWDRRSKIGLVGNTINITTGQWMSAMTGIGAGTDSFYEYLLKSYVLFGDNTYLDMYESSQESIRRNLLHDSKYFYKHVHIEDGSLMATWVDSLSAFMPGVQVLGGDLESAIKNHLYYYNIWRKYQAIPERFNFVTQAVDITNYPLRPEFVESNYFLYRATKDPFYLEVGEMILRDLQTYTKTKCGWSSLQSVIDKNLEDRMESFALSETFKYLFLLFDEENVLHQGLKDTNFVFTTEGHVLGLKAEHLDKDRNKFAPTRRSSGTIYRRQYPRSQQHGHSTTGEGNGQSALTCRAYRPPETFLKTIRYRTDADFARQMVGVREDARDIVELDPKGYCEKPTLEVERVVVEFAGPPKKTVFQDDNIGDDDDNGGKQAYETGGAEETKELRVIPVKKGVFVNRIVGVRMQLQFDDVSNGYRAIKVADHPLSLNSNVYVDHSSMKPLWDTYQRSQDAHLRLFKSSASSLFGADVLLKDLLIKPADFGYWRPSVLDYGEDRPQPQSHQAPLEEHFDNTAPPSQQEHGHSQQQPMGSDVPHSQATRRRIPSRRLIRIRGNEGGCRPFTVSQSSSIRGKILVVDRGSCLFILKAYYAQVAGAQGIVIINSDETTFAMSSSANPQPSPSDEGSKPGTADPVQIGEGIQEDAIDIHVVMVGHSEGQLLLDWIHEDETLSPLSSMAEEDARSGPEDRVMQLSAWFIQRKLTKEELASARLSYNNLPIVNIFPIAAPMATYG
ncbi:alpha mannosidase-like protein [Mortierella antarctica]|nr:alpha mannosidase-like protein [Mortierella antarctica]